MCAARTRVVLAVCTLSAITCVRLAQAAPAALVEFAIGNVSAVNGAGVARALSKGAEVLAGDTIDTGTGRAQLRFSDGAYISLQPGSQFRIDEYNYSGKNDDTDRSFFSLLKGGLRTITGLIGRTNRRNYQVRVPVATIGIRGTEYTLLFDGSARGSVGEGEISVCNAGGCLNVVNGQSYFVAADDVKPELSTVRSFLSAPPPPLFLPRHSWDEPGNYAESGLDLGSVYSANDRVNPDGTRAALNPAPTNELFGDQISSGPGVTTQPVALVFTTANFPQTGIYLTLEGKTVVRSSTEANVQGGRLISWADAGPGTPINTIGTATIADRGNLGQIAWGRFTNGTLLSGSPPGIDPGSFDGKALTDTDSLHYIVAKPTLAADLPKTGTLSYTLAGFTTPTTISTTARFLSASLQANFTTSIVDASVSVGGLNNSSVTFDNQSVIKGNTFSGTAGRFSGSACSGFCSGEVSGVFAGPQAQYAGFTYDIEGTSFGGVRGAVVLRK